MVIGCRSLIPYGIRGSRNIAKASSKGQRDKLLKNCYIPPTDKKLAGQAFATMDQPPTEGSEQYSDRWEAIWSAGLDRGQRWDAAKPSPALIGLLKSEKVVVKDKRVLVPGCGRGYDLPVFSTAGAREVVGLELSDTAAREAQMYLSEVTAQGLAVLTEEQSQPLSPSLDPGSMRIAVGDFFVWSDEVGGEGSWDVGYDYTFGCAMHPSMRADWARHWARQLRPGAQLVTLVFPVNPAADPAVGPPFPVSPDLYRELLGPHGFEVTFEEAVPGELSHNGRAGKEVMMLWQKRMAP